jgi:Ser/Thr protein kinase RdoA (MazF antagonist)
VIRRLLHRLRILCLGRAYRMREAEFWYWRANAWTRGAEFGRKMLQRTHDPFWRKWIDNHEQYAREAAEHAERYT